MPIDLIQLELRTILSHFFICWNWVYSRNLSPQNAQLTFLSQSWPKHLWQPLLKISSYLFLVLISIGNPPMFMFSVFLIHKDVRFVSTPTKTEIKTFFFFWIFCATFDPFPSFYQWMVTFAHWSKARFLMENRHV